jgi:mRNA interferase MazF
MAIERGDIWLVNLDPTVGSEMRKTRPVIVISSDAVGILPIRLVAPLTEWKDSFENKVWLIRIDADTTNGLSKTSAVDTLQLRGVDVSRFVQKLGAVTDSTLQAIGVAIMAIIEHDAI